MRGGWGAARTLAEPAVAPQSIKMPTRPDEAMEETVCKTLSHVVDSRSFSRGSGRCVSACDRGGWVDASVKPRPFNPSAFSNVSRSPPSLLAAMATPSLSSDYQPFLKCPRAPLTSSCSRAQSSGDFSLKPPGPKTQQPRRDGGDLPTGTESRDQRGEGGFRS